jgi:hypothetical protein
MVRPTLEVVVADGTIDLPAPDRALVLTAHDSLRAAPIALGVPTGHVICLADVVGGLDVAPWLDVERPR